MLLKLWGSEHGKFQEVISARLIMKFVDNRERRFIRLDKFLREVMESMREPEEIKNMVEMLITILDWTKSWLGIEELREILISRDELGPPGWIGGMLVPDSPHEPPSFCSDMIWPTSPVMSRPSLGEMLVRAHVRNEREEHVQQREEQVAQAKAKGLSWVYLDYFMSNIDKDRSRSMLQCKSVPISTDKIWRSRKEYQENLRGRILKLYDSTGTGSRDVKMDAFIKEHSAMFLDKYSKLSSLWELLTLHCTETESDGGSSEQAVPALHHDSSDTQPVLQKEDDGKRQDLVALARDRALHSVMEKSFKNVFDMATQEQFAEKPTPQSGDIIFYGRLFTENMNKFFKSLQDIVKFFTAQTSEVLDSISIRNLRDELTGKKTVAGRPLWKVTADGLGWIAQESFDARKESSVEEGEGGADSAIGASASTSLASCTVKLDTCFSDAVYITKGSVLKIYEDLKGKPIKLLSEVVPVKGSTGHPEDDATGSGATSTKTYVAVLHQPVSKTSDFHKLKHEDDEKPRLPEHVENYDGGIVNVCLRDHLEELVGAYLQQIMHKLKLNLPVRTKSENMLDDLWDSSNFSVRTYNLNFWSKKCFWQLFFLKLN